MMKASDQVDQEITQLNEVECFHVAGKVDFFLKINVSNLESYHEFVRTKLSNISNVGVLESYFVLKQIKQDASYFF